MLCPQTLFFCLRLLYLRPESSRCCRLAAGSRAWSSSFWRGNERRRSRSGRRLWLGLTLSPSAASSLRRWTPCQALRTTAGREAYRIHQELDSGASLPFPSLHTGWTTVDVLWKLCESHFNQLRDRQPVLKEVTACMMASSHTCVDPLPLRENSGPTSLLLEYYTIHQIHSNLVTDPIRCWTFDGGEQ